MTRTLEEQIGLIAEQLKKGVQPPEESVRTILSWVGAERRGSWVVERIRKALDECAITTTPNFEQVWIDARVEFVKKPKGDETGLGDDPTYRVGRLDAANKPVIGVNPSDTLQRAVTLMLTNDFSQLPVMTGPRDVKGVVSWKTIGSRLAIKKSCLSVKDCMEPAQQISQEESLLDAVDIIRKHDYVIVIGNDKTVSGLVTASDFNQQFRTLAEPFLLVGEIENGIRRMLRGKFKMPELRSAKDSSDEGRAVNSPSDLTFGEYIRLLENPANWRKLEVEIDRTEFIKQLKRIREIRNEVMHFDPDGLDPDDLKFLSEFAQFLKRLRDIAA
jgi:CBS domain-containing protein